jgi:hypothetical protein
MPSRIARIASIAMAALASGLAPWLVCAQSGTAGGAIDHAALDRLEAEIQRAEDVSQIKRLQRTYGYYLDKGMWADLAEFFADDAVANYPAGVYIGKESIRRHLYLNVGGVEMGETGLGDGRLYNHMSIQPVVHLDPGGRSAKGRWRALAMFGSFGGQGIWAEGVYEMTYVKDDGVWKIATLDYHAGFGAPYVTGWVDPGTGPRRSGPRDLPHPADRERDMACEGFPDACIAPFHYDNPGTSEGSFVWVDADGDDVERGGDLMARAETLARRAERLVDEQAIENLQRIYGFYLDQGLWREAAALFADQGTIELGLQGLYRGTEGIEAFLGLGGPAGGANGWLNDRVQLQIVVTVGEDGRTAKSRSRELAMTGVYENHGHWSEGIYENGYVKHDGVWKFQSMRFYPTFVASYGSGWTGDAEPLPGVSVALPPDSPPTELYEIYPAAHIPPYHYANPVTGESPVYPREAGRPSRAASRAATARVAHPDGRAREATLEPETLAPAVAEAARAVARVKDYHELENLQSAYGYYLDKNLWNDLADLFAEESSMELAQRGVYAGPGRVRAFLLNVFGRAGEGPVEGQLGNHIQWQPVITVAADGRSAKIRSRMWQQMSRGGRASMGAAIYENEAVKEDGRWKFSNVHAFNTWGGGYEDGWVRNASTYVPGPSADFPPDGPPTLEFDMFPNVYDIPFHYERPVSR